MLIVVIQGCQYEHHVCKSARERRDVSLPDASLFLSVGCVALASRFFRWRERGEEGFFAGEKIKCHATKRLLAWNDNALLSTFIPS